MERHSEGGPERDKATMMMMMMMMMIMMMIMDFITTPYKILIMYHEMKQKLSRIVLNLYVCM